MALIRTCQAFVSQSEKRNAQDFAASIADQIRSRPVTEALLYSTQFALSTTISYIVDFVSFQLTGAFPMNVQSALISLREMQLPRPCDTFQAVSLATLPPTRVRPASKPLLPLDEREAPPRQIHRDRVETKNNVNLPVTLYSVPYPFSPRAPPTLSASVGVSPSWTL